MVATKSNEIGRLVKMVRLQLGLSQEKLAAELGVTFSTVNRWENSKVKPSPLALKQLENLVVGLGADGKSLREEFFTVEQKR
ncbi:helix-turn-helix domain-containing protein [Stieleria sp. TO1_6]|uniref:helix-turn-helix domain-containing protein n=1 Tax=Stieleria tagensis TaxID=2956795 RepID=UPI00209AD368|nr:helix-turn-helix transcriptional regulator [Stieleria tagensis]MCO8123536.1 helix-turn-helix domain-containing protein [Stieleria tagensis]